jgi:hypothetical protein
VYKPFGFWRFIESETDKKLENSAKLVAKWFPERVSDFISGVKPTIIEENSPV